MANIGFYKGGKSVIFNSDHWGPVGGDNEAPFLLYALAKSYPQHTFWILGKSDYSRYYSKKPLLPNIKDIWSSDYWPGKNPNKYIHDTYDEASEDWEKYYAYVCTVLDKLNIKIDFAITLGGIFYTNSLHNMIPTVRSNPGGYAKTLECATKYNSFICYWLNKEKPLYVTINTDPRHAKGTQPKDIICWEKVCLSQIDKTFTYGGKFSYWPKGVEHSDINHDHINVYAGVETMHMFSKLPLNTDNERSEFNLILNQGMPPKSKDTKPPRYYQLDQYILSKKDFKCNIYGKWDNEIISSDERFRGPIAPTELGGKLKNTKYTLCIPIEDGWCTAKFTEMAHFGIIPFVTSGYASEAKGVEYIDKWFVVNNSKELFDKIEYLNTHQDHYILLRKHLQSLLSNMYNGNYMFNKIIPIIKQYAGFDFGERIELTKPIYEYFKEDHENATIEKPEIDITMFF